mmetsp:Transcript_30077/g.96006  ORF Transcript_30077/g.96006 Transcript_30077/m.96006 type:complete len:118 (+) Transcript_30077:663-1016(+)
MHNAAEIVVVRIGDRATTQEQDVACDQALLGLKMIVSHGGRRIMRKWLGRLSAATSVAKRTDYHDPNGVSQADRSIEEVVVLRAIASIRLPCLVIHARPPPNATPAPPAACAGARAP